MQANIGFSYPTSTATIEKLIVFALCASRGDEIVLRKYEGTRIAWEKAYSCQVNVRGMSVEIRNCSFATHKKT